MVLRCSESIGCSRDCNEGKSAGSVADRNNPNRAGVEFPLCPPGNRGELAGLDPDRAVAHGGNQQRVQEVATLDLRFADVEGIHSEYAASLVKQSLDRSAGRFAPAISNHDCGVIGLTLG